jgi:hypothetical protein
MKRQPSRESRFRSPSRPIIERVIRDFERAEAAKPFENVRDREKALRAAFREAYPWDAAPKNARRIWLDEIKRVRGLKPPLWISTKELERAARLIAENESRYGTPESKQRLLDSLAWRPRERGEQNGRSKTYTRT